MPGRCLLLGGASFAPSFQGHRGPPIATARQRRTSKSARACHCTVRPHGQRPRAQRARSTSRVLPHNGQIRRRISTSSCAQGTLSRHRQVPASSPDTSRPSGSLSPATTTVGSCSQSDNRKSGKCELRRCPAGTRPASHTHRRPCLAYVACRRSYSWRTWRDRWTSNTTRASARRARTSATKPGPGTSVSANHPQSATALATKDLT